MNVGVPCIVEFVATVLEINPEIAGVWTAKPDVSAVSTASGFISMMNYQYDKSVRSDVDLKDLLWSEDARSKAESILGRHKSALLLDRDFEISHTDYDYMKALPPYSRTILRTER